MTPQREVSGARAVLATPAWISCALALGVSVVLGAAEGGYFPKTWYPAALFLLGLLAVAAIALPRPAALPRTVQLAAALLIAYTAWSYLSITWASDQGYAFDGANRTLLYLVAFCLAALWPLRPEAVLGLVAAFGLAVALVGLVELLRLAGSAEPAGFFFHRRLAQPLGYYNANVAFWFSGFWACAFAGTRRELPPVVRALALGGAGTLTGLALMGQSRGWFFTVPLVALLFVIVVPGRGRSVAVLLTLALAGALMSPPVLEVHDSFSRGAGLQALVDDAARAILVTAAVLAAAGLAAALLDRRITLPRPRARAVSGAVAGLAAVALAGGLALWAAKEDPGERISDAWSEFKTADLPPNQATRFTSSLGSGRYDIWRVAWKRFGDEPFHGIGADNFLQDFLRLGKTAEQPRYPHSVELRTLSQTGVVGGLLLAGALAAALAAAIQARRAGPLAGAAAAGALAVFLYWLVHGSVDWFWEMPALGLTAFVMLGIAAGQAPGARASSRPHPPRPRRAALAGMVALVPCVVALGAPWLAERQVQLALHRWRSDPTQAFARLDRASGWNPLSSRAHLIAGTIALRLQRSGRAQSDFRAALERDPQDFYATIELGAIASERGRRAEARRLVGRAARLAPRDPVGAEALRLVRSGHKLRISALNRRFLAAAQRLTDPD